MVAADSTTTSNLSIIDLRDTVTNRENENESDNNKPPTKITVTDMIGEYGFYQLSITLLAFIRYVILAMMTNSGPLIAPDVDFWCQVPDTLITPQSIEKPANISMNDFLKGKCSLNLVNGSSYTCSAWIYNTTQYGVTLTDSFDLVCEHDFYRSTYQSATSIGVAVSSVVWGSFSDSHGRNFTIRVCFMISLLAGAVSYLAESFLLYTMARAVCSFSDLGLVVSLSTIIVESLGNKYRGAVCIVIYTGWSCGVMIMPWLTEFFRDFRQLMLFLVICHLVTLPWLATVGESVRWSMINGRIAYAKEELARICKWRRVKSGGDAPGSLNDLNKKFDNYKKKFDESRDKKNAIGGGENRNQVSRVCWSVFGGLSKVGQLFQSREMAISTLTIIWVTFTSELLYMLFTLINSDIGEDVKLNYAIGGIMEILATIISIVIISRVSRKVSLSSTLSLIAAFIITLAFTHQLTTVSVFVLNADKLAISTLSSLIYVATTEIFPTNLRQTGFGLSGTLGSLGAVLAPFVRTELTNFLGMTNVMLIVSIFPITAALIIPFFLRETKDVELLDEVDDIE